MTLGHHELCFGCGNANLFGLQMELEPADGVPGAISGRFFVKQDHQGPSGRAHPGVVAAALEEAMSAALHSRGIEARPRSVELALDEEPPLGVFLRVDARAEDAGGGQVSATATLREVGEGARELASARALYLRA